MTLSPSFLIFGDIKEAVKKILEKIPEEQKTCLIFGGEPTVKEVATNINNAYYTAYQQYADAGYPSIECKVKALSAAKIAKSQGEESIEARFGTLETKMADVKTIAKAQAENSGFDLAAR